MEVALYAANVAKFKALKSLSIYHCPLILLLHAVFLCKNAKSGLSGALFLIFWNSMVFGKILLFKRDSIFGNFRLLHILLFLISLEI